MAYTTAMLSSACPNYSAARQWNRREILRAGGLSLFGLSLPELLAARGAMAAEPTAGKAKACILLFMWGGPAHQDTWDLKPQAPAEIRGEFQPISTSVPGIQICEHLPLLAARMQRLALVRSLTHGNVDHTLATHFLLTGQPPPPGADKRAEWPHMGASLARLGLAKGPLPPYVNMRPKVENGAPRFVEESRGQAGGWLGPVFDPLTIDQDPNKPDYRVAETTLPAEVPLSRLNDRRAVLAEIDRGLRHLDAGLEAADKNRQQAFELLTSAAGKRGAFEIAEEPAKLRERYGLNPHGQSVLQARRLVEAGVPLVTVFWPNDGLTNVSVYWDTHNRNFVDLRTRLMPVADQAFSALLDDLAERGLLDSTLVVWTGEFGRTPRIGQKNSDAGAGSDGRDHWPGCFTSVLAGGGIKGGMVHGQSDKFAAYPERDPVAPVDLTSTIFHLLGVPPLATVPDHQGRPQFVRPGRVIREIL